MSKFVKQGELEKSWDCIQACEAGCYSAISSSSTTRCRCWICSKGMTWKITEREEDQWSANIWVQEGLHYNAGLNCSKDAGKISTQVQLGKEAGVPRSSEDGVYTRRGCEDVSSCATKADSFRVENTKPGWFHSVSVQEVCVWFKEAPPGAVLIIQAHLHKTRLLLMWHTEQGWRIQRVVVHIADSADPLSQSGCCWKRVFYQQRSAGSKRAGDELESNQTCAQLCCISEDKDIRLHCDWQTSEIL